MSPPDINSLKLFNEIEEGQTYPHNDKWYSHLLEQYKIYVEMADRISNRRATANSYFLSINSAILAFIGYITSKGDDTYLWLLALAGITLSFFWHALINSYKNLNTAKWLVVHEIEKRLPISPYAAEWDAMGRGNNPNLYKPITHIELGVPKIFMGLHALVLIGSLPLQKIILCLGGA